MNSIAGALAVVNHFDTGKPSFVCVSVIEVATPA
jgi:hypothetical protein